MNEDQIFACINATILAAGLIASYVVGKKQNRRFENFWSRVHSAIKQKGN